MQKTPPPVEKKKRKKKEVPSTGIELAKFDFTVWWFHPLLYSGMNWEIVFTLPFCTPQFLPPDTRYITYWYWYLRTWYHEVGSLNEAIHKQSNTSSRQYR